MRHTMRRNQHQTPGLTLSRISKINNHEDRLLGQHPIWTSQTHRMHVCLRSPFVYTQAH